MILFKKQKEQKEPKKEIHRSSGDFIVLALYPCPDLRVDINVTDVKKEDQKMTNWAFSPLTLT